MSWDLHLTDAWVFQSMTLNFDHGDCDEFQSETDNGHFSYEYYCIWQPWRHHRRPQPSV